MNQTTLHWSPETGFELDADFEAEDVSVRMVRVPVPADGTKALTKDPVKLHPLDVLFKSQVDVDGAPGQLDDVRVQLLGDAIRLKAIVEDAETGETRDLAVELPVALDGLAPDAGGPVPTPPDEDSLDWEDEETFERLFDGAPETTGRRRDPDTDEREISEEKDLSTDERQKNEKGLAALLKALMNPELDPKAAKPRPVPVDDLDEDEDDESDEAPLTDESEEIEVPAKPAAKTSGKPAAKTPVKVAPKPEPTPPTKPPMQPVPAGLLDEAGEARSFLQMLVDEGHLELSEEGQVDELVPGTTRRLASRGSAEDKAEQLSKWLLSQDAVDELYIDDDELAELIEKW